MRLGLVLAVSLLLITVMWITLVFGAASDPSAAKPEPPKPPATTSSSTSTSLSPPTSVPPVARTAPMKPAPTGDVAAIIRAGFARFGPDVAEQAVRVAQCESTLNPAATNGHHAGLFQIAEPYHRARIARLGFTWAQMLEAGPNVAVAADLYGESGWQPWSCWWAA